MIEAIEYIYSYLLIVLYYLMFILQVLFVISI